MMVYTQSSYSCSSLGIALADAPSFPSNLVAANVDVPVEIVLQRHLPPERHYDKHQQITYIENFEIALIATQHGRNIATPESSRTPVYTNTSLCQGYPIIHQPLPIHHTPSKSSKNNEKPPNYRRYAQPNAHYYPLAFLPMHTYHPWCWRCPARGRDLEAPC